MNIPTQMISPLNVNFVTKDFQIMNTQLLEKCHSKEKSGTKNLFNIEVEIIINMKEVNQM